MLLAGAPKDRDGGICESPLPYPLDSNSSTRGFRCGGILLLPRVYRDIGIRYPVLSLIATSTWCLGALCSALYRSRFSRSCLAYFASFSLLGGKKRCLCSFDARFLITADREMVPISFGTSPFHQIGWVEPYWKKAFVWFGLLNNRHSITVSAKTIDPTAVSANPTKNHSKTNNSRRHEQSIPPIMKNERPKPNKIY